MSARALLLSIVVVAMVPRASFASEGAIAGRVTAGSDRAPVAGAVVQLRGGAHEERRVSDQDGRFVFEAVDPDRVHTLVVEAPNFQQIVRPSLVVRDGGRLTVDVHLELAAASYLVRVDAESAPITSADVRQSIEQRDIDALPTVTGSTAKLALLDPHVRQAIGLGADFQDANRLSINAASYRHTGYVIDGVSAYDWIYANAPQLAVSRTSVRDLQVVTGPTPAQFGLSASGVIAITTASGAERTGGEVFGLMRPSGLQAKPPVSVFRVPNERSEWGADAGGPLTAAHAFYFASYQRTELDRGSFIQSPQPRFFTGHSRDQQVLLRLDRPLRTHALTLRLNGSESTTDNANDRVGGFNQPSFGRRSHAQSTGGLLTERMANGNSVNDVRVSLTSYVPDSAKPLDRSVQIVRPNYATTGYSTDNWVHARTWQLADHLTITRGRHTVTAGGELVWLHARDYSFTPLGTYTYAPGPPRADDHPTTYSQTFGAADLSYGQTQGSVFVQDEIRATPRVSVNVGVRYEAQSITDSRANVGPRAAVTWAPGDDSRTRIRAGGGVYYDQYYLYLTRRFITLGPRAPQASYSWSWEDPGFPAFPASFTTAPTGRQAGARDIMIPADRLLNPVSPQMRVGIERDVRGMTIEAAALHSRTYRQMRVNDINHPAPFVRTGANQIRSTQAANATRPYTVYEGVVVRDIAVVENTAESTYTSLDVGLTRRSGRTRFAAHYLWSASTAYAMFYGDANSGVPNEWYDDLDRGERGPSDFHQPHRVVVTATLPVWAGFEASFVSVAASGLPVNPITGRDNNGDSYTVDRPVGLERNSFRGPSQFNLDLAIVRPFRVVNNVRTELRLEAFNVTNHRNYIRVNNVYGEGPDPLPTFLTPVAGIGNADPSRQLQFGLRLMF